VHTTFAANTGAFGATKRRAQIAQEPAINPAQAAGELKQAMPGDMDNLFDELQKRGLSLDALEDALIQQAVERAGGNLSAAARSLGLTRPQLSYRLQKAKE